MASIPWYPILTISAVALTALVSYYSSQISLAAELGDRPTRQEMNGHITELKETIVREIQDVKDQQRDDIKRVQDTQDENHKETRQDFRDLRQIILDARR